jgi:hypothetical protein
MHSRSRITCVSVLALGLLAGCITSRTARIPQPGSTLTRVAELPNPTNVPSFDRACAMRLREDVTGREYLLVRSDIRTERETLGSLTATVLASASGDYALIRKDPREQPEADLRVDCSTSRVIAVLAPGA